MPKRAGPWFRRDRQMWFATLHGKQYPLEIKSPNDRAAADAALVALVARLGEIIGTVPAAAQKEPTTAAQTVSESVAAFLAKKAGAVERGQFSAEALRQYRIALSVQFARAFGPRSVCTLTADDVQEWADGYKWSDTTRANRIGAVATFLSWAKHPLELARPAKESRGAETVLTDEQFAQVLAAYDPKYGSGDLRELLVVLRETGARPQEVAPLTVEGVDWPNACSIVKKHKNKRKGKGRVLYFSAAALAVLERQWAKHQTGYLFRTRKGNAYREKMIVQQMQRISERVGFRVIAYGLGRHSFATKALVSGIPDTVVASLLGHGSTRMVHSNYGHVSEQSRVLREAVEKVSGAKAG